MDIENTENPPTVADMMDALTESWNKKFPDQPYLSAAVYKYKGKETTILALAAEMVDGQPRPLVIHMAGTLPQATSYDDFVSKYKPA